MIRIAIVNDLPLSVEALRRIVLSEPGYAIAWTAADGAKAVEMAALDRPDVILMDLIMPVMDGAEATRIIMQQSPCAILVVTATVESHAGKVFDAMGWGALDAVDTPMLGRGGQMQGAERLLAKIAMLAPLFSPPAVGASAAPAAESVGESLAQPLVVIGASTGGPAALAVVLSGLSRSFRAPIVIVQHVDALFAPGLAEWLSAQSGREVCLIHEGLRAAEGAVLLAGSNDHLRMNRNKELYYSAEPHELAYRPSVDVFFRDVAQYCGARAVGVLLTGMGADGAEGLLALRRAGAHTIAQDEASSVVYGMPRAAVRLQAAVEVAPLEGMADAMERAARRAMHAS